MLAEALYPPQHPYNWLTIGAMEDLESASLRDVSAFFQRFYVPANASLALVGDTRRVSDPAVGGAGMGGDRHQHAHRAVGQAHAEVPEQLPRVPRGRSSGIGPSWPRTPVGSPCPSDGGTQRHWFSTWMWSGIGTPAASSLLIAMPIPRSLMLCRGSASKRTMSIPG